MGICLYIKDIFRLTKTYKAIKKGGGYNERKNDVCNCKRTGGAWAGA